VNHFQGLLPALGFALVATGCGGGTEPNPGPTGDCARAGLTNLAVGGHAIIDASLNTCVRIPATSAAEAEYLYVAFSGEGMETFNGVTADYETAGAPSAGAVASVARAFFRQTREPDPATSFHLRLRERERGLSRRPGVSAPDLSRVTVVPTPPPIGDQRSFEVCATAACTTFVPTTATALVVNARVAVYLDDNAPQPSYSLADLDKVAQLFDTQLYPIDTTAFGRESDLDNNGVVIVLLTQKVNDLTPTCPNGSLIVGYFFGLDLLPSLAHSNKGEIFYGIVPRTAGCPVSLSRATALLPGVFIHEFQHMISFNQHVLIRSGIAEDTWLNEGLSHFAEELGGRQVPDANCQPAFATCEDEFIGDDISNGFDYLNDTERSFLIEPTSSGGTLAERGANWLFVRWLADQFAASQPLGTDFTRKLVQTSSLGSANVAAVTGQPFDRLVGEWQLANYLDNLAGFTPQSARLQYSSWNFRALYLANFNLGVFPKPYPLVPDSAPTGGFSRIGVLRGGSGRHVLVLQQPAVGELTVRLTAPGGASAVSSAAKPRAALVRIR